MIVYVKVRTTKQKPCTFLDSCPSPCDWCKTHDYSEACVPMLIKRVKELEKGKEYDKFTISSLCKRREELVVENAQLREQFEQRVAIADGKKTLTLEELARKICDSYTTLDCDSVCPARNYCRAGHNGMMDWLRKVVSGE